MTKNVVIVLLVVGCLVLTVYAQIQATEAKRQSIMAEQNMILALKNAEEAKAQMTLAVATEKRAHEQQELAEQALAACSKQKK